jgi:flagellar basal-body rod modification protein FlgD
MVTRPLANGSPQGNQVKSKSGQFELKSEDFIKMMITQLQNQDPMEPAKNEELLAQMSQIGQLQANTLLTESLKGLVLQNQIGSAGNMIGKAVEGMDDKNEKIRGVVNSVRVEGNEIYLELDNGKKLNMSRVTSIASAPSTAKAVAT